MGYRALLDSLKKRKMTHAHHFDSLEAFYGSYAQALKDNGKPIEEHEPILKQYIELVIEEIEQPYRFENFHQAIRAPIDYYQFGLEIMRPLIQFEKSEIHHSHHLHQIEMFLAKKENVIFLANHQIEPDPQIISLMLEKKYPRLAEEMIFVAGHRVVNDPLAIPFSKGRNLLCIYSKKHIENPPELKEQKQIHNQRTMHRMSDLLAEGGKCIYVAPSGGRDRPHEKTGKIEVAPFDSQSIEMFWLMAQHSGQKTHFYPLSLATYDLLAPPQKVAKELGEKRYAKSAAVRLSLGNEIDMIQFPGSETENKKERRTARAHYIWNLVKQEYERIC